MSIRSLPNVGRKGRLKPDDVIHDCDSTGVTANSHYFLRYIQLQRQGRRLPHQRYLNLCLSRPEMPSAVKWQGQLGQSAHVTCTTFMASWFVLPYSTLHTKRGIKLAPTTPLLHGPLSETGGTPRRASHIRCYET